ncbi:DsbA family protein [Pseudofrankia sp. EUN1h]|uniref:DsbA family protein n=1 Tax=Pseudofrankia sp. EUN1h TaxID=1834515 RepID=UPI000234C83B|nr:DsbA family protein [Pseudofrankia sp. EUN1h]OHV31038.1 hypothetical protein BCD49_32755 [Pseudofrankia sp. EUN1h]
MPGSPNGGAPSGDRAISSLIAPAGSVERTGGLVASAVPAVPAPPAALAAPARLDERPSRGDVAAPVVLVEYGDFQCPYCAQAAPVLHELVEQDGALVRHEFRHFPVFEIHPYALTAALAAEAAYAHGKFWQMHDLLFAHQDRLKDVDLRIRAERLGLDPDLVVGDAAQPYGDAVEVDYERGIAEGVRGTPTLFINGQMFRGRPELSALRRAVRVAATSALVAEPAPVPTPVPVLAGSAGALFADDGDLAGPGDPAGPVAPAAGRARWWAPWAARR